MIDKQTALEKLIDVIKNKRTHKDYEHVVEYAELFTKFVTGKNVNPLMKRFTYREDDLMYQQRETITEHIVKPCSATAMKPLFKLPRVTPVVNTITYETPNQSREQELKNNIETFFGGQGIDTYLEQQYPSRCGYDPNSFFLCLFNEFNFLLEKPKPYIIEVNSEQAIYFEYFNNELELFVVRTTIDIDLAEGGTREGYMYQIYVADWAYQFTQVDERLYSGLKENEPQDYLIRKGEHEGETGLLYKFDNARVFLVEEFQTRSGIIPAVRVGSVPDPETEGRTMVGILDNAKPYFMKTIKAVSELDLTMSLHCFPQKIVYTPKCVACKGGLDKLGAICSVCNGTMRQPSHTSAQETVEMPLPDERNLDKMIDLSKLVYYVTVPVDGMKFQNDYVDSLSEKINKSIYNSDTFVKETVVETAFKQRIGMESVYDTLQPYGTQYCVIRTHLTRVFANYLDLGTGLIVKYSFPRDFKFKPLNMLLEELKSATESGAPAFVIAEINNDIRSMMYQDRPREFKKLAVKDLFFPFDGKKETEIQFAIGQKTVPQSAIILYSNFKDVFINVERAAEKEGKDFYELEYDLQKQRIDAEVERVKASMRTDQVISIDFPKNAEPDDQQKKDDAANKPVSVDDPSLATSRLSLALQSAVESGDKKLVAQLRAKILEMVDSITVGEAA